MADRIQVVPSQLREAAAHHQHTSEQLRAVPSINPAIQESLDSLGPVFGELREAGRELLEIRRQCYEQQADDHADLAHNLELSASLWEQHEQQAAAELGAAIERDR
ncbi:ESX-1 secretion-associated protein [Mycobacterium sp.]|uniref:ESX-1 secretion-associated protein n=1 Tax=Mycobacterium sp. TaxID=1785 RepID=UPI003A8ADBC6